MAPRKLLYTADARDDLEAILHWQMQPGAGPAARRRVRAIRAAIERLRQHPCLHPVADNSGRRELSCEGGHRVLYRVRPDTARNDTAGNVLVLRVFGPGQFRDPP